MSLTVLIAWAIGVVGWDRPAAADPLDGAEWAVVKCTDFTESCVEDGRLLPVKVTTIGFMHSGRLAWAVEEGTRVKKGEPIATQETDELKENIQRTEDDLAVAERGLAQQRQARELETKRLDAELQSARDGLELAGLKEKETLGHPTPLERDEADNLLKGAQARLAAAHAELDSMRPLVAKGYANRADLEAKELALKLAETDLANATLQANLLLAGAIAADRDRARLNRQQAEVAYKLKELDRRTSLEKIDAKIDAAEHSIKRLNQKLADQKREFEDSTRLAPHDGIVVYREIGWGEKKKLAVGDRVSRWQPPFDLPSYEKMKVRAQIPESVVRRLATRRDGQPGSKALIRVKTLPGRVYHGEVIWIDGWARDRNANLSNADVKAHGLSGLRVFDLEVELEESDPERLREGFKATVEFPIATLRGVIVLPEHAVRKAGRQATVRVASGSGIEERVVQLGAVSNGQVVIASGLKEGERVLIPPAPTEEVVVEPPVQTVGGNEASKVGGGSGSMGPMPSGGGPPGAAAPPGAPTKGGERPPGGSGRRRGGGSSGKGGRGS
ncbi:MAG: hypothetical protein M5U26_27685 [Planctomycetota bacterium]|nr:hypothetical protein [Planctomycetota bacterium]